jgi:hypothetical protein
VASSAFLLLAGGEDAALFDAVFVDGAAAIPESLGFPGAPAAAGCGALLSPAAAGAVVLAELPGELPCALEAGVAETAGAGVVPVDGCALLGAGASLESADAAGDDVAGAAADPVSALSELCALADGFLGLAFNQAKP